MSPNRDDPAVVIARNWHKHIKLIHNGIDYGRCAEYDILQVINRSILTEPIAEPISEEANGTDNGEQSAGEPISGEPARASAST